MTVIFRVILRSFAAMMRRMRRVAMGRVCMMRRSAMISVIVVPGGVAMMLSGLLVMVSGRAVVFSAFVVRHMTVSHCWSKLNAETLAQVRNRTMTGFLINDDGVGLGQRVAQTVLSSPWVSKRQYFVVIVGA